MKIYKCFEGLCNLPSPQKPHCQGWYTLPWNRRSCQKGAIRITFAPVTCSFWITQDEKVGMHIAVPPHRVELVHLCLWVPLNGEIMPHLCIGSVGKDWFLGLPISRKSVLLDSDTIPSALFPCRLKLSTDSAVLSGELPLWRQGLPHKFSCNFPKLFWPCGALFV